MHNALLYILTVLVWGTTWFAIKLQVGHAPDEISILYRAGLAAFVLLAWCKIKKLSLNFEIKDHVFLCGLGLSMFSVHALFVYSATNYIASGVIAVVFSTVSFLSIVHNFLFFRTKPTFNICLGAFVGILGICVFFWDEILHSASQTNVLKGLGLAAIGTLIFSFGGIISRRNHDQGLDLIPSMTMGMIYGTLAMLIYTLFQSSPFVLPKSAIYWGSLFYLAILGSVVAVLCFLKLVKNIGPELASYTTILFPVIALIISSVLEGYTWSPTDFFGLVFVLLGNVLVMRKKSLRGLFNRLQVKVK